MKTFIRLDKQCSAHILATTADRVLFDAFWPADKSDHRRFFVTPKGIAHNIVETSRKYFELKYGKVL